MTKAILKPQTFAGTNPALMVSCGTDKPNIITIAWSGIINSIKPMLYISVRKERYSYGLIEDSGEFVVNIVTKNLLNVCDDCGVKSGKFIDKFEKWNLTKGYNTLKTPYIHESPVSIECVVTSKTDLGSHVMFIADIVSLIADENVLTDGKIDLKKFDLVCYCGGGYYSLGERLASYGFMASKKD
jgi:flavin reductase (DIM6/NTAB) family NADH-FMN oxidoreductase RutF